MIIGLGLLGWTALSTLNNQSNSESRSFENQVLIQSNYHKLKYLVSDSYL